MDAERRDRVARLRRFWPELAVACCWLLLFLLSDLAFKDDESMAHHATHAGLWLSAACYLVCAMREHRSSAS